MVSIQTPLSTIFRQFYLQRKPKKTSDLSQVTGHRLDQITISSTPLLCGIRTHNFSGDRHRLIARVVVNSTTRWSLPRRHLSPILSMFLCCRVFEILESFSRIQMYVQLFFFFVFFLLFAYIWICCWRSRLVGWVHINHTCTKPSPGFPSALS